MPQTNEGILLVIGALFLLLGLLGGGFEISALKVPPIGTYTRAVTLVIGLVVFSAGLYRLLISPAPTVALNPTATPIPTLLVATLTPLPPPNTPTASPAPTLVPPTPLPGDTPVAATVQIQDVRVEYDATRFERKGMVLHVKLNVTGLKDVNCRAVAYFYLRTGAPLKDKNGLFTSADGNVSASQSFTPTQDSANFDNLEIFIPYDELELGPGSYQLKFFVSIFDMRHTQNSLANSLDINFDFSK